MPSLAITDKDRRFGSYMKLFIIKFFTVIFIISSVLVGATFYEWLSTYIDRKASFPIGIFLIISLIYQFNKRIINRYVPNHIDEEYLRKCNPFVGRWLSDHGQSLWIVFVPIVNWTFGFYKPNKGRRINFLICSFFDESISIYVGLHFLHFMEAMLVLTPACDIETRREVLIPALESGPESDWMQDDLGFPWVFPLSVFWRS